MTRHIPEAVFWCLLAGALAVVILLIRERQISARLRRTVATLEASVRSRDEEIRHLATVRLPALMESGPHQPAGAPGLLHGHLAGSEYAISLKTVSDLFSRSAQAAQARADQSAKAALKASMRTLQGLANEQQLSISEMQDRHDNADVLQDLLAIDHTNSQFGRRAQAIAVLCGSWPGRQRSASSLVDVVRGATSRIRDYRRVQVHAQVDIAIVSRAVEPVVLTVAELLDNAARHSQPNTTVQVNIQPAHNGTAIVIDDAGVGLIEQEIRRATELLSGAGQTVDITRLGDPPQFGFAAIGVLAARYGFSVSVDTRSPYGGVRAVVFLPSALLTRAHDEGPDSVRARPPARHAAPPRPSGPVATEHVAPDDASRTPSADPTPVYASTAGGLPKRRRRQPTAEHTPPAERSAPETPQGRSAQDAAAIIGAFARGTRSGRASSSDHEGNPHT
ncbi:ATP-binding protein [Streptantibioticus ferralitis]|uniref:histidine kinase n=1 Tax=Streptantibioticus ferralitis TaxID=236510 RepID=A0ABT5Z2G5_9ACTN|nr:ATP-binding protein [Streptantibioticus ferralitis]MDF2258011.1 ATP-binding protein [Streptantibioticus ferralitis]